jgi:dCMP deaminase
MSNDSPPASPLGWDEYFMQLAHGVKLKSKDVSPVGAVLINEDRLVVSTGYNGMARSLEDDPQLLGKKGGDKLDWMVHAEHNAILNAARNGVRTLGCRIYVTKFPCFICLQVLIQAGVMQVYTDDKAYWGNDPLDASHDGKRYVIQKAGFAIEAPNHPSYHPALPPLRHSVRRTTGSEPAPAPNEAEKKAG